jgi:hypothetical protein
MFGSLYPEEDDPLEEEGPKDGIANSYAASEPHEGDEDPLGDVPNYNGEKGDYVDFLGVESILNSPNNDCGKFYAVEENYLFTRETMTNPLLSIFMACGRENA